MKVLVTGVGGFVAGYVVTELRAAGHDVFGSGLSPDPGADWSSNNYLHGDLCDPGVTRRVLAASKPGAVIHLAAQSHPARSWEIPAETLKTNILATMELVRCAAIGAPGCRVAVISSADVYGTPGPAAVPFNEASPLHPDSPYAVSKAAAEQIAQVFGRRLGIGVLILRAFSHTGPGQTPDFVVPSFARQIALIEAGRAGVLEHGDLTAHRDFTDVRDVARAYRLAVERAPRDGVFNICSGRSLPVSYLLETLVGLASKPVRTHLDPSRVRSAQIHALRGDASAFAAATGWMPQIPIEQTLRDVLESERARVSSEPAAGA